LEHLLKLGLRLRDGFIGSTKNFFLIPLGGFPRGRLGEKNLTRELA